MNDQDKNNQDIPEAANDEETPEEEVVEQKVSEAEKTGSGDDGDMTPEEEVAELKDKLLRTLADMENLRRRSQKDREDALKYSSANFARDMLSVADNLRRAIDSIPEDGDPDGAALVGFIEGISLTEKELLSTLERHGIRKIDPMGEKFDPQFHEAMFEIPSAEAENGTVLQVVEVGYVIHDRLLRPAKVGIAKAGPAPSGPGDQVDTTG
ncbi:MAG: nucleotide exchange factor GrpE [Alphaproteobacteria bacterium]|nr:nucleotide exchange factor GrpE [Alphaproteobacteria bacterium]